MKKKFISRRNLKSIVIIPKREKGLLGNLPEAAGISHSQIRRIRRANRYLNHQSKRIEQALQLGQYEKVVNI